jgi:hypothetical protein
MTREMGQLGGELQMLLCCGSKAIIKYVVMRRPIFEMSTAEATC